MPKVNLLALARPARRVETRTFTDPAQPGVEVQVTLRSPDAYDITRIGGAAEAFVQKYGESGFPMPSGECIQINAAVAQPVCALELMQPETVDDPYRAEEFLGMLVNMPTAWKNLAAWVNEWVSTGEQEAGNSPKGRTGAGSARSSSKAKRTPNPSTTSA